ncbi:MAG: Na+/H+ antiporter family protein [Candidatus Gastranaerophilaceae bacterium]
MSISILLNPVIISVVILCILCVRKVNVLLALILAAIIAGVMAYIPIDLMIAEHWSFSDIVSHLANVPFGEIMKTFVSGMGGNSETALSYILLGTFAAAMMHTGLTKVLADRISKVVGNNKYFLLLILTVIAVFSQNLIPVHIAFIPILIPPLLGLMNRLEIDRRAVACALAFGLKTPYIVIPAGFGLIFQGLIADNLTRYGMPVSTDEIWKSVWILGLAMLTGLLISIFITYRKPRTYENSQIEVSEDNDSLVFTRKHAITLFAAFVTFMTQIVTKSLPLGAIAGLTIIFGTGVISHEKTDKMIDEGVGLMGYIAFVMLIAAGYAMVLQSTGSVDSLINAIQPLMQGNKLIAAVLMLIVGLFITIGIGTSFGTIPILAVLFVPICQSAGFSVLATIVILAAAAALGDAGSPASDTTLGPTAGLNADGQHNHIKDTCIPTFLHYNIPLIVFALLAVVIF